MSVAGAFMGLTGDIGVLGGHSLSGKGQRWCLAVQLLARTCPLCTPEVSQRAQDLLGEMLSPGVWLQKLRMKVGTW